MADTSNMMACHQYQHWKVAHFHDAHDMKPILCGASKEDPSKLGETFGAVCLDNNDYDPQERFSLYDLPTFVQGSLLDIPFEDKYFAIVVLGEILEHCPWNAALQIMRETRRVLKDNGRVVLTIPLDDRPPEVQHEQMIIWEGGITNYHQTVWEPLLWSMLLAQSEFVELQEHRQELNYGFCKGFGAVLRKAGSN